MQSHDTSRRSFQRNQLPPKMPYFTELHCSHYLPILVLQSRVGAMLLPELKASNQGGPSLLNALWLRRYFPPPAR
eukprot:679097-Pelagomonas_calceolata.AAC.2